MNKLIIIALCGLITGCSYNKTVNSMSIDKECELSNDANSTQCKILNMKELTLPEKQTLMGYIYFDGSQVPVDYKKSKAYFDLAAQSKNNEALNFLGMLHDFGKGVEVNKDLAIKYYSEAINYGNKDAIVNLAELYRAQTDFKNAEIMYKKGLSDNPKKCYAGLGKLLAMQGDYNMALSFFKKAANLNDAESQYNLGVMYEQGLHVSKNIKEAKIWYHKAAKQGYIDAQNNLDKLPE